MSHRVNFRGSFNRFAFKVFLFLDQDAYQGQGASYWTWTRVTVSISYDNTITPRVSPFSTHIYNSNCDILYNFYSYAFEKGMNPTTLFPMFICWSRHCHFSLLGREKSFFQWVHAFSLLWFDLVHFYGISNLLGYSMENLDYIYILNVWFLNIFLR